MDVISAVAQLIDQWCERRALRALRCVLQAWPYNGLTDGAALLMDSLEKVRAFAGDELTKEEGETLDDVVSALQRAVYQR
jgi:hypothetical protein